MSGNEHRRRTESGQTLVRASSFTACESRMTSKSFNLLTILVSVMERELEQIGVLPITNINKQTTLSIGVSS